MGLLATTLTDIKARIDAGTFEVFTGEEFVENLLMLASALYNCVGNADYTAEHDGEGRHKIESGTTANRPVAIVETGLLYFLVDGAERTLCIEDGTTWYEIKQQTAANSAYTNTDQTAFAATDDALDFLLNLVNTDVEPVGAEQIKAIEVAYQDISASQAWPFADTGVVETALKSLRWFLYGDAGATDWGLQASDVYWEDDILTADSDVETFLDTLNSWYTNVTAADHTKGAKLIGFDDNAASTYLLAEATVQDALMAIDTVLQTFAPSVATSVTYAASDPYFAAGISTAAGALNDLAKGFSQHMQQAFGQWSENHLVVTGAIHAASLITDGLSDVVVARVLCPVDPTEMEDGIVYVDNLHIRTGVAVDAGETIAVGLSLAGAAVGIEATIVNGVADSLYSEDKSSTAIEMTSEQHYIEIWVTTVNMTDSEDLDVSFRMYWYENIQPPT